MRISWSTFSGIGFAAITLAASGCSTPSGGVARSDYPPPAISLPPPGPQQVTVNSRWNYSAYEDRPGTQWLLERARDSAGEGAPGLDRLVQRWPDLTLELLRYGVSGDGDLPLCLSLADSYDRTFDTSDPASGWYTVLNISAPQREAYDAFRSAREQLLAMFQSGRFSDAAAVNPVAALPAGAPPALQTEALRLEGLSALLNDHPDRAADCFNQALATNRQGSRHVQFELGLLLSESERRLGHTQDAAVAWENAIASAARVRDPDLWERAILTKPANVDWPPEAAIAGAGEPSFTPGAPPDMGDVLIGIGKMRLVRGAAQSALLSFSRAEAETPDDGKKSLARIYRVQSMITLHLAASALPMLDGLMQSPDRRIACRAQAIEGDVYCRVLQDRARGIPMMQAALQDPQGSGWPGKSRLSANLALYYLLEGNESKGLPMLHMAEAQFESLYLWEDLAHSLQDEAAYLRAVNKNDDADVVQRRADQVCREAGLPGGPLTDNSVADNSTEDSSTPR